MPMHAWIQNCMQRDKNHIHIYIYIYNIHTMYVPFQLPSKMHIQFPPVRCSRLIWGTLNDQAPSDDSFLFWDHQLISCLKSALLGLCNELPSDKQTVCELEAMAHLVWCYLKLLSGTIMPCFGRLCHLGYAVGLRNGVLQAPCISVPGVWLGL